MATAAGKNALGAASPRLARRPETRAFTVAELVDHARRGVLRIPAFQRRLKWESSDKLALFDSIERGYPIGTLLFWKRAASAGEHVLTGVHPGDAAAMGDALWIVDGQQRLTALTETMLHEPQPGEPTLGFDLVNDRFEYRRVRQPTADFVPARVMLDESDLAMWANDRRLEREAMRPVFEVGKRLRTYTVLTYTVEDPDERVVRHIFDRVNDSGRPLEREDIFNALVGSLVESGPKGIGGVQERLRSTGFGVFPDATVLNAMEAIGDLAIGRDAAKQLSPSAAGILLERTSVALERTVAFLRESSIPRVELLPYTLLPVVVLAKIFDRYPELAPRTRVLLRRWLWRGALAHELTGAGSALVEHARRITGKGEASDVTALMMLTGQHAPPVETAVFSAGTARGKLELCALYSLRPRDLRTGDPIRAEELFESGLSEAVHVIIGPKQLKERAHAASIANRLIHPLATGGAANLVLACEEPALLASHAIDRDAREALVQRRLDDFLTARSAALAPTVDAFLARHAEWKSDDSPSLGSLRVVE